MAPKAKSMRARSRPKQRSSADKLIVDCAMRIHTDVKKNERPSLKYPVRSLSNVHYDGEGGTFVLNGRMSTRDLSYTTAKTFAQSIRMMSLSKQLVETDDSATKREA